VANKSVRNISLYVASQFLTGLKDDLKVGFTLLATDSGR
jgi:hypothetical protein